ncbi:MAG: DNA methyltransferase [Armatimonadota bacterium]
MRTTTDGQLYRNEFLFAQAYLEQLLAEKYDKSTLDALGETIKEWRKSSQSGSAAQLLASYVGPVLDSLHFVRQDDPAVPGAARLLPYWGAETPVGGLIVIDHTSQLGCTLKGLNWAEKLVRYMHTCGAGWGVLTDGETWRLYRRDELAPYDTFLEVSLGAAIDARNVDALRIFHRFFTADAFVVDADDRPALETYRQASIKATQEIEKHLKSSMDDVLRNICLGFVRDEGRSTFSQDERDEIFNNSVYLLYRIVFILYAESRGLLPTSNAVYADQYSLKTLTREAVEHHFKRTIDPTGTDLWVRLRKLFVWVDEGHRATPEEDFEITEYDGELFDSSRRPYLSEHLISNEFLAEAIYQLNCMDEPKRPGVHRWIDYRDLSVRHLGSLYEALLEYKLYIAEQPMVARVSGDKVQYVPQSSVQLKESDRGNLIPSGGVYFGQSPTERKRSGSYYTPEDVVDYIVSNTVCKGLEDLWGEFRPELEQLVSDERSAISEDEQERLQRFVDESVEKFVRKQVFTYRILDPAMGSGHFLVNALQKVTNFIVEKLNETPWTNEALDTSPGVWRRRAVERCMFGVDVNPLATELAKLSLWLASASEGKPLSFLNHHLKTGNSLIGARLPDLRRLPGVKGEKSGPSLPLYVNDTIALVLSEYEGIAAQDSDAMDAVEDKKRRDKHIGEIMTRVKDLANVWVSTFYGNHVLSDQYAELLELAGQNYHADSWSRIVKDRPYAQRSRELAQEKRFFHWDLEFAEAFRNGAVRFDAVIANPPYVGTKADSFITHAYASARCGDTYGWMLERGMAVASKTSSLGAVVPLSITFGRQFSDVRGMILDRSMAAKFANFDNNPDQLFQSPDTRNGQRASIVLLRFGADSPMVQATDLLRWANRDRDALFGSLTYSDITPFCSQRSFPRLGAPRLRAFWLRITSGERTGSEVCRTILSESQKDTEAEHFLIVPRAVNYFLSAFPVRIARNKVLTLTFNCQYDRDLMGILVNSNVFYWYWRVFGDGFVTNVDTVACFPVPELPVDDVSALANELWNAAPHCKVSITKGIEVPNYNFNKRMDILLKIDDLIVRNVAPDLALPRGIFAQYKSNSFLRPLDLASLPEEPEGD